MSEQAAERAGDPSPLTLMTLGRFRLRDFDEAVRLCSLAGEGIAADRSPRCALCPQMGTTS